MSIKSIPSKTENNYGNLYANHPTFSVNQNTDKPTLYGLLTSPFKMENFSHGSIVKIEKVSIKEYQITLYTSDKKILDKTLIKLKFKNGFLYGQKYFYFNSIFYISGIGSRLSSLGLNSNGNLNVYCPQSFLTFFFIIPTPPFAPGQKKSERINRFEFPRIKEESNENAARDASHP